MLFKDTNRIDLTLVPKEKFKSGDLGGRTIWWVDKDHLFSDPLSASQRLSYSQTDGKGIFRHL